MKSKFAKLFDGTVGALLVFFAATAILLYFTVMPIALTAALSITSCAAVISGFRLNSSEREQKLTDAADTMFFDFMFCGEKTPARLLYNGLKRKGLSPRSVGGGVYLGSTAAFTVFDGRLDDARAARLISRAAHNGAKKVVALCKLPPAISLDVSGFKLNAVSGNDVYKLFASLGALPKHRFDKRKKRRLAALAGAFDSDKLPKYFTLTALLIGFYVIMGSSLPSLICAGISAILFVITLVRSTAKTLKEKH